jgi:hypothetical protein
MGANEDEENYFMKRLESDEVKMLPKKVTTEYSIPERQKLYLDGGVLVPINKTPAFRRYEIS